MKSEELVFLESPTLKSMAIPRYCELYFGGAGQWSPVVKTGRQ